MKRLFSLLALVLAFSAQPILAAPPLGFFESTADMERQIGDKIKALDFVGALETVDPAGRSLSAEQKDRFVNTLAKYFRRPLTNQALLKEEVLGGGFRRTIHAYWRDDLPIYLYLVSHTRADGVWVLQYNIETTFSKIINNF